MAKQGSRAKSKSQPSAASASKGGVRPAHSPGPSSRVVSTRQPSSKPADLSPVRRTTYLEAVALYERGLAALQRHDYAQAIDMLESVLRMYPEEKELHERVRLYLNICQRQAAPHTPAPKTV